MTRTSLTKVLEYREFTKEQLEAETAKARERLNSEQGKLDALENKFTEASEEFSEKQQRGHIRVHDIQFFSTYCTHLNKEIRQQKAVVEHWTAELEKNRQAMLEAYKEHKVVELLHGRIAHAEMKEADKGEQKAADYGFLTRRGK